LLLVDDHPILREGFARLIDQEADLKVAVKLMVRREP